MSMLRLIIGGALALTMCNASNDSFFGLDDQFNFGEVLNYTNSGDYTMTINIGNPPQRVDGYSFVVDTSVSTLITTTTACTNCTH